MDILSYLQSFGFNNQNIMLSQLHAMKPFLFHIYPIATAISLGHGVKKTDILEILAGQSIKSSE